MSTLFGATRIVSTPFRMRPYRREVNLPRIGIWTSGVTSLGIATPPNEPPLIVSGGADHTLRVSCLAEGKDAQVRHVSLIVSRLEVHKTELLTCSLLHQVLEEHSACVTGVVFEPDGSALYSGSWDGKLLMWMRDDDGPKTWSLASCAQAHVGPLTALSCQLTVPWVISGGRDRKLRLWGRQDRNIVPQVVLAVDHWLYMIGSHQQLPLAATVEHSGLVRVWRISPTASGLPPAAHDHPISAICVSSEGALLACGCKGGHVKVWCAFISIGKHQCRLTERRYGGLLDSHRSLTPTGWRPTSILSWASDSSRATQSCSRWIAKVL